MNKTAVINVCLSVACLIVCIFMLMPLGIGYCNSDNQEWNYYSGYISGLKSDDFIRQFAEYFESRPGEPISNRVLDVTLYLCRAEYLYYKEFNRLHTPKELNTEYAEIASLLLGPEYLEMEFIAFRYKEDDRLGYLDYYESDFVYLVGIFPNKDFFAVRKQGGQDRNDLPLCGVFVDDKIRTGIYPIEDLMVLAPPLSNR